MGSDGGVYILDLQKTTEAKGKWNIKKESLKRSCQHTETINQKHSKKEHPKDVLS